ncbi:MAG: type III pantothenate kinase [Planctomycetota bacterium]
MTTVSGTPTQRPLDPSDERGVVAIDLGNTAAKLMASGSGELGELIPDGRGKSFRLDQSGWAERVLAWVRENVLHVREIRIASVNRGAADQLRDAIESSPDRGRVVILGCQHVDLETAVPSPDRVGIDRLIGAFAAVRLRKQNRGSSLLTDETKRATIVVDAGSAITVDMVDEQDVYRGGAIMPGLEMQTRALATGTDLLPQIDWANQERLVVPGPDTVSAIQLGVMMAAVGAIERLIHEYAVNPHVILAGGDAQAISTHVRAKHLVVPDLVCKGILLIDRDRHSHGSR